MTSSKINNCKQNKDLTIAIGCDHAGFDTKQAIIEDINKLNIDYYDCGCFDSEKVDYPDIAKCVCENVVNEKCTLGILVCGTGIGMSIASNKIKGIRAANVTNPNFAKLSRQHNNANILCLSGRFIDNNTNIEIVHAFLNTNFEGERHERRINKITCLEN